MRDLVKIIVVVAVERIVQNLVDVVGQRNYE